MKAKINQYGNLEIFRGGAYKPQLCPFTTTPDIKPDGDGAVYTDKPARLNCGDWCPLLGEPYETEHGNTRISVCQRSLIFTEFEDEREKDQDKD